MLPSRAHLIRILLVEDAQSDVRLMREALAVSASPHELLVVQDGEQAMRFLHREPPYTDSPRPDLIFLDLNLPKMDGREVLSVMKKDARLRSIPVIVLTTSGSDHDVCSAYDLHANCYIRKPGDLDEFLRIIRACEEFWFRVVRLPQ